MNTELYKAFKGLPVENLVEEDKEELLKFFIVTENSLIRNQIAIIFSDLRFNKAIPYLIKKINDRNLYNNNGTLVWALGKLDAEEYFINFIKIICEQEYEARLMAYDIVERFLNLTSIKDKNEALEMLESCLFEQEKVVSDKNENSTFHFLKATKKLIANSLNSQIIKQV